MRLESLVVAALAAGTTLICVPPASAQPADATCADFPTQIDIANSVLFQDPSVFDPDGDGIGCEENPAPPTPYNTLVFPPVEITDGPPIGVSPASGGPGTVVTVNGEGCVHRLVEGVIFELFNETTQETAVDSQNFPVEVFVTPAEDGSWSGQLTVPPGLDPDDAFVVAARCFFLGDEDTNILIVRYEPVAIDVTGTPTPTPPTPPTPAPAPPAPPAPPAEPVVDDPTFTG